MSKLNIRQLKAQGAALAREHREGTRGLVLLYCGVIAALSLVSNGLNLMLSEQIGGTGGLGGLGMRSMLQTIQEILSLVNTLFGPFWSAGFLYAMLVMVRGRTPGKGDLAEGFRRFGKILGALAFEFLVFIALVVFATNLASVIYSFLPMGEAMMQELMPLMENEALITADGLLDLELLPEELLIRASLQILGVMMAVLLPLLLFVSYSFRMALYLVMERPIGGVRAHFESARLMRGHKWQMLKLDLSFWWYYLLLAAASVIGYLDMVLGILGVQVPVDPTVLFFGTLVAYCVLYALLCLWKKREVDAAYVLAYESIAYPEELRETV